MLSLVPIDKATGNVAVICQRFYAQVLVKELGLNDTNTTTYVPVVDKNNDTIINNQRQILKPFRSKFTLILNPQLNQIHWNKCI